MPFLMPLGVLTGTRFGSATEHAEFLVEDGPNGPVVRVISYVQRVNVTLTLAPDAAATEAAVVEHRGARVALTVDGWTGSITPLALTAARDGMAEGRSVTAFLQSALPTETQMVEMLAVTTADGASYLYAARPQGSGIAIYQLNPSGDPVPLSHQADGAETYLNGVRALTSVRMGAVTYLVVGSEAEDGITVLRVGPNGALTAVENLGINELVPVNDLMALCSVEVGGRTFVLAAASGSSSLTVFEMGADGQMVVVDHLVDTLGTRFDGVRVFEVVTVGDRVFVLAAGADDGLSLFTLLPDGRLLHLETLADTASMGLSNITAMTVVEVNGQLQVLVLSGAESGLTALELDLSSLGLVVQGGSGTLNGTADDDLLRGAEGVTSLSGGAGDDILIDGAGSQDMTGGAGADVFVLTADGDVDTIRDFDYTRDRIDLSLLPYFRNPSQVQVTYTSNGAVLTFGDETLVIITANGQPLTPAQIAAMTFGAESSRIVVETGTPADPPVDPPPNGRPTISGTAGNDALLGAATSEDYLGGAGNDTLTGMGGADLFNGGDGFDIVSYLGLTSAIALDLGSPQNHSAEVANDLFIGIEGFIGTAHADRMTGSSGNDWFEGGSGGDHMQGMGGADMLSGGGDNDLMRGGWGNDTVQGGDGHDKLSGDQGDDSLTGGTGNDTIGGGSGRDTVYGGDGNDQIGGGDGDDILHGEVGSDALWGGAGNDSLYGGTGLDTLYGGLGDDVMGGGGAADVFVFDRFTSGERDRILDFSDGSDLIRLEGVSGATPEARLAALSITAASLDGISGALIRYDGHEIFVQNILPSQLTLADFQLI